MHRTYTGFKVLITKCLCVMAGENE